MAEDLMETVVPELVEEGQYVVVFRAEPGRIIENLSGLKEWLDTQMEPYKDFQLTESNLKEAKSIRAKLNKTKEQLETERKRLHDEYEKEYTDFYERYKNTLSKINDFIKKLGDGIKTAEDAAKAAKRNSLIRFIQEEAKTLYGETLLVKMEKPEVLSWFIDPKWLLSSSTTTSVQLAVREKLNQVQRDYDCILKDAPYPSALDAYNRTGSLSAAFEARRREEALKAEMNPQPAPVAAPAPEAAPAPVEQLQTQADPQKSEEGDFTFDGKKLTFILPENIPPEKSKTVKLRPITLIGPKWALLFVRKVVYPALGITVEKKEGKVKGRKGQETVVTDLPGIYSLSPYTLEEVVSRNYILHDNPDVIIDLVDATNIDAHRREELERAASRRGLGVTEHHADLLA